MDEVNVYTEDLELFEFEEKLESGQLTEEEKEKFEKIKELNKNLKIF